MPSSEMAKGQLPALQLLGASPTLRRVASHAKEEVKVRKRKHQPAQGGMQQLSFALKQLTREEQDKAVAIMFRSCMKQWLVTRGRHLRPPRLHQSVSRVIGAWFELVDDDGSGGLDSSELAAALKAAGLPCDEHSILEMIKLMDINRDGEISWKEFEEFLAHEFAAGKALLSGEYVLPSGTALPFGAMVSKLRRNRIMADIFEGGEKRGRWAGLASDTHRLQSELNMLSVAQQEQQAYRRQAMLRSIIEAEEAGRESPTPLMQLIQDKQHDKQPSKTFTTATPHATCTQVLDTAAYKSPTVLQASPDCVTTAACHNTRNVGNSEVPQQCVDNVTINAAATSTIPRNQLFGQPQSDLMDHEIQLEGDDCLQGSTVQQQPHEERPSPPHPTEDYRSLITNASVKAIRVLNTLHSKGPAASRHLLAMHPSRQASMDGALLVLPRLGIPEHETSFASHTALRHPHEVAAGNAEGHLSDTSRQCSYDGGRQSCPAKPSMVAAIVQRSITRCLRASPSPLSSSCKVDRGVHVDRNTPPPSHLAPTATGTHLPSVDALKSNPASTCSQVSSSHPAMQQCLPPQSGYACEAGLLLPTPVSPTAGCNIDVVMTLTVQAQSLVNTNEVQNNTTTDRQADKEHPEPSSGNNSTTQEQNMTIHVLEQLSAGFAGQQGSGTSVMQRSNPHCAIQQWSSNAGSGARLLQGANIYLQKQAHRLQPLHHCKTVHCGSPQQAAPASKQEKQQVVRAHRANKVAGPCMLQPLQPHCRNSPAGAGVPIREYRLQHGDGDMGK